MACVAYLQGLTTSCGSNLASIKKLWIGGFETATFTFNYQQNDEGQDVKDFDDNKIIESLETAVLKADKDDWVEFQFRKNTGEMTSEMTRNDNGSFYFTNGANLVFAKQDKNKRLALQATASGDCTIIIQDSNNNYWLIGAEVAVTASAISATTGVAVGDANQYTITLSADEAYMPIPLAENEEKTKAQGIVDSLIGVSANPNPNPDDGE